VAHVLTICPYRLLPLRGGGALRCFHLLRQLARFHDVHAIVFQREAELRQETDGYMVPDNVHICSPVDTPPPRTLFDWLPARFGPGLHYRWLRRSWRGPAEATLLRCAHLVESILAEVEIDAVIFEELGAMATAPLARRLRPPARRVVNLYNVNHRLMGQELAAATDSARRAALARSLRDAEWQERHLGRYVDAFLACSDDDRVILEGCSGLQGYTVPNGVDTEYYRFEEQPCAGRGAHLLFCGSLTYAPNVDGLKWFSEAVWPLVLQAQPAAELTIVGRGGTAGAMPWLDAAPRVRLVGEVPDTRPYYASAAVAICPLRMGSGTRLKVLEAMSAGTPVVSTTIGAEGICAVPGEHILLSDTLQEFAQGVTQLLTGAAFAERMRRNARGLVARVYDWNRIGEEMNAALAGMMDPPA
jgi:polysaccharide biosynthesis protein PslH